MEEEYVTIKSFNHHNEQVSVRIGKVEDEVGVIKNMMAENKGYHRASLEVLNDIKNNTKTTKEDLVELTIEQGTLKNQFGNVLSEFETVKSTVKAKRSDNKDIIIKLLWVIGTLGGAALGASWLWM